MGVEDLLGKLDLLLFCLLVIAHVAAEESGPGTVSAFRREGGENRADVAAHPMIQTFPPGRVERMERWSVPLPPTVRRSRVVNAERRVRKTAELTLDDMIDSSSAVELEHLLVPFLVRTVVDAALYTESLGPRELLVTGRGGDDLAAGSEGDLGGKNGHASRAEDENSLSGKQNGAWVCVKRVPGCESGDDEGRSLDVGERLGDMHEARLEIRGSAQESRAMRGSAHLVADEVLS